jgi:hypothetical protein
LPLNFRCRRQQVVDFFRHGWSFLGDCLGWMPANVRGEVVPLIQIKRAGRFAIPDCGSMDARS